MYRVLKFQSKSAQITKFHIVSLLMQVLWYETVSRYVFASNRAEKFLNFREFLVIGLRMGTL